MTYTSASLLLIVWGVTVSHACLDSETIARIEALAVDGYKIPNNITGLGLSIVRDGQIILAKGYGKMDIEANRDFNQHSLSNIGSITKSMLGVLVVKTLHEKYPTLGEAVLDVPITQLIPPNVNFTLSDRYRSEHVSFRDILSHKACILNHDMQLLFGLTPSSEEFNFRIRFQSEACQFRNGFFYNNALYGYAGDLIAMIAGSNIETMLLELLHDMGMTSATFIDRDGNYEKLPDFAKPYVIINETVVPFNVSLLRRVHVAIAAGAVLSSATDMGHYMNFHLNLGRVGNTQVVPEEAMRWFHKISNPLHYSPISTGGYATGAIGSGIGLEQWLYKGYFYLTHGGYWPPYRSHMVVIPGVNIGIFIASNGPGMVRTPTPISLIIGIFDILQNALPATTKIEIAPSSSRYDLDSLRAFPRPSGKSVLPSIEQPMSQLPKPHSIIPEDLVGIYGNAELGDIRIVLHPRLVGTLQFVYGEWGIGRLEQLGDTAIMEIIWETDFIHDLYTYGPVIDRYFVKFTEVDRIIVSLDLSRPENDFVYVRNATLDTFPTIPWSPYSCGPTNVEEL